MQRILARLYAALLLGAMLSTFPAAHAATAAPIASTPADPLADSDGYDLWLRYRPLPVAGRAHLPAAVVTAGADSPTLQAARAELQRGLAGMTGKPVAIGGGARAGSVVLARGADLPSGLAETNAVRDALRPLGSEGYLVRRVHLNGMPVTLIAANADVGLLYGSFAWLRQLQLGTAADGVALASRPQLPLRVLNHWDNLDRTVERGYAGESIWNFWELPGVVDPRYTDYARANASLGINGTVLNNVNAKAEVLSADFIAKAAAVADVLRPYGMRVYLSVRWSTPLELKETKTADPLDPDVAAWWKRKADEIYKTIPDFGGFLVKANSEGQPGPQDYHRNHAEGANMLARALAPHHGIVMWRAFVYASPDEVKAAKAGGPVHDRAGQAYEQFQPLDGKFDDNVLVQVKNGAIDFQPREPAHPLFGAMPKTPLVMEFQITKEYLGYAMHLAYLGTLFEETLRFDTRAGNRDMTVAQVLEGAQAGKVGGIAGVANIGSSRNWTGSTFDQANWYAFGRLAWDQRLDARAIAREWAMQTFAPDARVVDPVADIMMRSREAVVDYMTPLGLHHLMGTGHHHGPAPWVNNLERADWNPAYYHRAGPDGIGFDRGAKGSDVIKQYAPEVARRFADPATTPSEFLLWFHHLPWTYKMPSGRTLWPELIAHYDRGVDEVAAMEASWQRLRPFVDARRFDDTARRLAQQHREAQWWRDACIAYFQHVSGLPLPADVRAPAQSLQYYESLRFPYAPGRG
jgi:alpha-glucuronidase